MSAIAETTRQVFTAIAKAMHCYDDSPEYHDGDEVEGIYCNRCGQRLVIDLTYRQGRIFYYPNSPEPMRSITGGWPAYDSDVVGVVWCPICKDGTGLSSDGVKPKIYTLLGKDNHLEVYGGGINRWLEFGETVHIIPTGTMGRLDAGDR